jgi:protein-tyrosine phosphatase
VVNTIGNVLGAGGRVLLHCMGGISRSPALAAAYVIWRLHLRWAAAVAYVRERRECVNPNGRFLRDLEAFDRAVFRDETLPTVPNKNR